MAIGLTEAAARYHVSLEQLQAWAQAGELDECRRKKNGRWQGYRDGALSRKIRQLVDSTAPVKTCAASPATPPKATEESYTADVTGDTQALTFKGSRIRTLDDALRHAAVDTAVWEVERYTINSWEMAHKGADGEAHVVPLWQVKVWLRRKLSRPLELAADALCQRIAAHAPAYPPLIHVLPSDAHLLEICLFDHHFGKYAWARETGENYDLHIAETLFARGVEDLLSKAAGFNIEQIQFPVGQDFLHIDNVQGNTAAGTPQDTDGRLAKIVETGQMAVIHAIDRMREVAPVRVVAVPGNHESITLWHVARFLMAWYRHCADVTVDVEPQERKYTVYGQTLIGYTHGNEEAANRLPVIMATEKPQEWAATKWHEWHTGHLHKKRETQFVSVEDHDGVIVRILPTLTARDSWTYRKGYHSTRLAEANLYSRERGATGFVCTTLEALKH